MQVQIEYISFASTLAFPAKENSHSVQCHDVLARSWGKHERIERALAHERGMRCVFSTSVGLFLLAKLFTGRETCGTKS